jgi:arylsulfatase A-like enzyme
LVNSALAVAILVLGALLARALNYPALNLVSLFLACLLVYEPLRVAIGQPVSKSTVAGISIAAAILLTEFIRHTVVRWRKWYVRAGVAGACGIALLVCSTELHEKLVQAGSSTSAPSTDKNVLIIVVDTLRADHLSLSGYSRQTTPYLDRFAASGVVFDNAVAASSWTLPSHASMLTGRYPHEHHALTQTDRLGPDLPMVSEWFAQHGYRTGGFSANHLFFSRRVGLGRGFEVFKDVYPPLTSLLVTPKAGQQIRDFLFKAGLTDNLLGRQSAETMNGIALKWMERDQRPFFAVINYFDVHDPYVPPEGYWNRYGKSKWSLGGVGLTFDVFPKLTDAQVREVIDMYDDSVAYTDVEINALLQEMERHGLLRNTVVVITSDHGEEFQEHGFLTHANALYTDLVRVPLIIVAPNEAPAAMRISTPVSLTSIPATVIDLATGQSSRQFSQPPLARLWRDPASRTTWPAPVSELAQMRICDRYPNYYESFRSVSSGDWQYIVGSKGDEQLFHVPTDPGNMNNVAGTALPQVLSELRQALAAAGQ